MITIYKYQIGHNGFIDLPLRAEILSLQMQGGEWFVWCKVDKNCEMKSIRRVVCYGTGADIKESAYKNLRYIATVQNQSYVWHWFEDMAFTKE